MNLTATDMNRHKLDPKGFIPEALQSFYTDEDFDRLFLEDMQYIGVTNKEGETVEDVRAYHSTYSDETRAHHIDPYCEHRGYDRPSFKGFRLEFADGEIRWLDAAEMRAMMGQDEKGRFNYDRAEEACDEKAAERVWAA